MQYDAFDTYLKSIQLNRNSDCSHPFDILPFFYYKRKIAATHSFKFTVFSQSKSCSNVISQLLIMIPPWFQECINLKVCYLMTFSVIISREHLKRTISQGHCAYFTTLVAIIYYNKRYVFDSRKFEGYVYLKKTILVLIF